MPKDTCFTLTSDPVFQYAMSERWLKQTAVLVLGAGLDKDNALLECAGQCDLVATSHEYIALFNW
jgi:hypothetical protein